MFLKRAAASDKFNFEEVYSCLQKSMRRGEVELAVEMGYEFEEYPNALKIRLIQNCCEDCPDIDLITQIFNEKPELKNLIKYIPVICKHTKCRDGLWSFRLNAENGEYIEEGPKDGDDLETSNKKLFFYLCESKGLDYVRECQKLETFKNYPVYRIARYLKLNLCFFYMLNITLDHNYDQIREPFEFTIDFDPNHQFYLNQLPKYIYDKYVFGGVKGYKFFIDNLKLIPCLTLNDLDRRGREIYIRTEKGVGSFIKPIVKKIEYEEIEKPILLQTQLITARFKPRVYFCKLQGDDQFNYILKGPDTEESLNKQIKSDEIKRLLLGDSYLSMIVKLEDKLYYLSENFIPVDESKTIVRTSKLETEVTIYNGEKFFVPQDPSTLPEHCQLKLLKVLLVRKFIGTNDTCNRNLLYVNDNIYSIDDPCLYQFSKFMFKIPLPKKQGDIYRSLWEKFEDELKEFISECEEKLIESDVPNRIKEFVLERMKKENEWNF